MSEELKTFLMGLLIGSGITACLAMTFAEHTSPYMQGQIDAQSGKIEYIKVAHPDGTITWERAKK